MNPPTPRPPGEPGERGDSADAPLSDREAIASLPFLLTGSVADASERERLQAWLKADPQREGELQWERQLRQAVQTNSAARARDDAGLERLDRLLREEARAREAARRQDPREATRPRWLEWLGLNPWRTAAGALAALQVAVIVGVVGGIGSREDEAMRSAGPASGAVQPQGPYLRVLFREGATEAAVRELLLREDLRFAAGPTLIGEYWLTRPSTSPQALAVLAERLRGEALVSSVVVDERPPGSTH